MKYFLNKSNKSSIRFNNFAWLNDFMFIYFDVSTFSRLSILLFAFHLSLLSTSFAQVNYEPVNNSVYQYLERMSNKGIIQLNEEIKPFSRKYIAGRLAEIVRNSELGIWNSKRTKNNGKNIVHNERNQIQKSKFKISEIENDELEFYLREFVVELERLGFDFSDYKVIKKPFYFGYKNIGFDDYNRFRLFTYDNGDFGIFVDPILKYEYNSFENGSSWSYSNGIKLYGNLGNNIGFDLKFYDNHPRGDNLDRKRMFSPKTGYGYSSGKIVDGFDFDRLNANLNFSWKYVTLSIGKDFNYYGNGYDSRLILSDKAPSFPLLKLEVYPTSWLKFSYIQGLLNSQVLDSTTFRFSPQRNHISKVDKYYVAHLLSITPYENLNISLGESIVYSDKFQPLYLVPFLFFRFADHYFTDPNENAGNAQLFGSFWYKNYPLKTKFYSSIFVDELRSELKTTRSNYPQAVAFNVGFKTIDPLIPESELIFEYTRINPFVYSHADSAQTYASYGYELGHWIGSNADEIFISFRKRFVRGLNLDLWYRFIRKGSEEDIAKPRYQVDQTFLWGTVNKITMYGASINYELIHSLNIKAAYEYSNSIGGNDYLVNQGSVFQLSLSYGL